MQSLRIVLHAIESAATKYKRYIEPWLSVSVDFYVRVFVRVHESRIGVKQSVLKVRCPEDSRILASLLFLF
jgi:tRNA (guanine26-N2/guanine27-N2)-dimethyltransferase